VKDIQSDPLSARLQDHLGRLRVGAAIGVGSENLDRWMSWFARAWT